MSDSPVNKPFPSAESTAPQKLTTGTAESAAEKRLTMLEAMTRSGKADSFAWYALGQEYRKLGRAADALTAFESLRAHDPGYLPLYLMAGQLTISMQRFDEARSWLRQGMDLARARGDFKTLSELESALHELD